MEITRNYSFLALLIIIHVLISDLTKGTFVNTAINPNNCKEIDPSEVAQILESVMPSVILNHHHVDGQSKPSRFLLNLQSLQNCFTFDHDIQKCQNERDPISYYRVVNKLVARTENCKIAVLYYHNGVTVDKDDGIKITEIKYYKTSLEPAIFGGFTMFTVNEDIQIPVESASDQGFRDINYWQETVSSTNFIGWDGVTIEVGSKCSGEIKATEDPVTCKRKEGTTYLESYAAEVHIVAKSQQQNKDSELYKIKDLESLFNEVVQKTYTCERNGKVIFDRVVNELLTQDSACVYYIDGVEVGWYIYPDKQTFLKIREVKYVDPTTKKVLKYDGQLVVITDISNLVERLYEGHVEFKEDKLTMLREERYMRHSLNFLRKFLLEKGHDSWLQPVNDNPNYKIYFNQKAKGRIVYRIGRLWDEDYTVDPNDPLHCMHDQWSQSVFTEADMINANEVVEYNGGKMYKLDFLAKKQLKRRVDLKVWICANKKDTILRMEVALSMLTEDIYGIIHPDSVKITNDDRDGIDTNIHFTETFYLSARTSKVLKIEGPLRLIGDLQSMRTSSTQPTPPPVQAPKKKQRDGKVKRIVKKLFPFCFKKPRTTNP